MSLEETDSVTRPEKTILHRIGAGLLDVIGTRIELVQLELEEEKRRLVLAVLISTIIGAFVLIGLSLIFVFVVINLYWYFGLIVLLPVAAVAFIIAALIFQFALRPLVSYGQTLHETVSQLKRDAQWLGEQFAPKKPAAQNSPGSREDQDAQ